MFGIARRACGGSSWSWPAVAASGAPGPFQPGGTSIWRWRGPATPSRGALPGRARRAPARLAGLRAVAPVRLRVPGRAAVKSELPRGRLSRLTVVALIAFAGRADRAAAQRSSRARSPGPRSTSSMPPRTASTARADAHGGRYRRIAAGSTDVHQRRRRCGRTRRSSTTRVQVRRRRGRARDVRRRRQRRRGGGRARVPRRALRARADVRRRGLHGPPRRPGAVLPGRDHAGRRGHRRRSR